MVGYRFDAGKVPFDHHMIDADGVRIRCAVGGAGPPVLLLHGYPQTHVIWHHVAPLLAEHHTVVAADLRGYGDSDKPVPGQDDAEYSKRAMARDQLLVMRALGFDRFAVAGHDRGGRVGHRLALDAPEAVEAVAVLDIVPTRHTFEHADEDFGLSYFHWFFLAAGDGIPEHLIGADPRFWVTTRMNARHHGGTAFDPAAVEEYVRCFSDPAAIAASCSDYRAAAGIDLEHDSEGKRRCSRCGASTASWAATTTSSTCSGDMPATCAAGLCRATTTCPRNGLRR
ncbi:alpha/beta fold hydrolase [Lentzea sp. NPDC059081]|uniref:alpha/beta fold hydrolase n=1 Tax=Lentzea sp. NPDC059081 TaxID=3346719 RepID=UPI00368832C8